MGSSPGRRPSAVWVFALSLASLMMAAGPAPAQFYDEARSALDLGPDGLERSPRLLGMGRLTLADDRHNRITMWDFAGNPTGVWEVDSSHTFEVRPGTSSASAVTQPTPGRERQTLALRESRIGFEAWHRAESQIAYGFYGDLGGLRHDQPFDDVSELRASYDVPAVVGLVTGPMPYLWTDRLRYALRLGYRREQVTHEYRLMTQNASGDYLSGDGVQIDPPNEFTPDEFRMSALGGGAALSYRFGSWLTAALGVDGSRNKLRRENEGLRSFYGDGEDRPYGIGQASFVGKVGDRFEWGVDGRGWKSEVENRWVFTIATGPGEPAFGGRGPLYERRERGTALRARARGTLGVFDLGGALNTTYQKIDIMPPPPGTIGSLAWFLGEAEDRLDADTLSWPDSIRQTHSEHRGWDMALGGSWHGLDERLVVGVEYHMAESRLDHGLSGAGPLRRIWDVRSGMEYHWSAMLSGRLGYVLANDDLDDFTADNEFVNHTVTVGLGVRPQASWTVEVGYAIKWVEPDYGDPWEPRTTRQQLASQVRWLF